MSDPDLGLSPGGSLPSPADPLPQPTAPPNTIFRGPNGIRAGWRVLIFVAIVAAIFLTVGVVAGLVVRLLAGPAAKQGQLSFSTTGPLGLSLAEGTIFFATAIGALIMSRIERRRWQAYGLSLRSAFRSNFWIGAVVGFLAISGCLFGIFLFHGFQLTGLAIHGETILAATLAWSATFILVGLAEEFAFRGYLQYTLTTGMGFWPSAILLSALFGLAHAGNPGESKAGLVSVVLFGLLFCLFLRRTGNLWWPVGFHAGWDWGQTFFYGVPDSGIPAYHNLFGCTFHGNAWLTGGTVGPEASIFTPVVLALVAIAFSSFYRQNRYVSAEQQLIPAIDTRQN
jgi:membrane protease YdiL (CAAX protease family)